MLLEVLISGIVTGSIYTLLALAINLIYSTTGIINFAHGEIVMLGGMVGLVLIVQAGLPFVAGLVITCVLISLVALLVYFTTIRPFGENLAASLGWLMTTLGAGIVLKNAAMIVWGTEPASFPPIGGSELISFMGTKVLPHDFFIVAITIAIGLFFTTFLDRTVTGSAIRATAYSHGITRLMGISAERMVVICFALSGMVAAIAGLLISPITFVGTEMTSTIGLKGFGAAVIGGIGSNRGAVTGGLLLGLGEALAMTVITPGYKDAICFLIMILAITIKPEGLYGVIYEKKV